MSIPRSIPRITFKNLKEAEKHFNALLTAELGEENVSLLDIYHCLLTSSSDLITVPYALVGHTVVTHMSEIGYSDNSIHVLFSRLEEDNIRNWENRIVMARPDISYLEIQLALANKVIDFFNTLE